MKRTLLRISCLKVKKLYVVAFLGSVIYTIITWTSNYPDKCSLPFSRNCNYDKTTQITASIAPEVCQDILSCLTEGSWVLRKNLSPQEKENARKKENEFHEYLGFPSKLHRDDGRCGANHSALPGSYLPALCDAYGLAPCCNENTGTCGSSEKDCKCEMCTDFSRYLHDDIAQWVPDNSACRYEVFNQKTACELLDNSLNELVFIGDSMTRHFFAAMAIVLTNNQQSGSHKIGTELSKKCQGDYQFIDNGKYDCQLATAHAWEELNRTQVCGGRARFKISLIEAYYSPLEAIKTVKGLLNKNGTMVIMNVGLHMKRSSRKVIKRYLGPILDLVEKRGNGWPKVIWHNLHSVDNFLRSSVVEKFLPWRSYNAELGKYCASRGIPVLDFYDMTQNIISFDGLHIGLQANLQKAQLLLNFLRDWSNQCQNY